MLIPYFVRELPALFVATTLLGLSFTLYNVLLPNLVGLLSEPGDRARNFSNSSLMGSTTLFIGPLMAGIAVDASGHANACLYLVALNAAAAVSLGVWGGALPGGSRATGAAGGLRETLADPAMLRILATSSLVQVGQDLYQFYIPVYGHGIGLSASAIGGLLATFAAASFVVRIFLPAVIARFGEEKVLAISFCVSATGFGLVPFFESVVVLALVTFVFGTRDGMRAADHHDADLRPHGAWPLGRNPRPAAERQQRLARECSVVFGSVASVFDCPRYSG
jgi:cyanate permease